MASTTRFRLGLLLIGALGLAFFLATSLRVKPSARFQLKERRLIDYRCGAYLAVSKDGRFLSSGTDENVSIFDMTRNDILRVVPGKLGRGAFGGNRSFAYAGHDGIQVWDTRSWKMRFQRDIGHDVLALSFPQERYLVFGKSSGEVGICDLEKGVIVGDATVHQGPVWALAEANAKSAASGSEDGHLVLWSIPSLQPKWTTNCGSKIKCISYTEQGDLFVIGTDKGELISVEADTGAIIRKVRGHAGMITGLAFSLDQTTLLTCGTDWKCLLWDSKTFVNIGVARLSMPIEAICRLPMQDAYLVCFGGGAISECIVEKADQ